MLWNIYGFVKALFDYRRKAMIEKAVASGEISDELKELAIKEYLAKQKAMAEANAETNTTDVANEEKSTPAQKRSCNPTVKVPSMGSSQSVAT